MFGAEADAARRAYRFGSAAAATPTAVAAAPSAAASRLAGEYLRQIHREFALADLSQYGARRLGLRWRTRLEVAGGKGESSCGELSCARVVGLHTFEVPFTFTEDGARQTALVKVRLCGPCSARLLHAQGGGGEVGGDGGAATAAAGASGRGAAAQHEKRGRRDRSGGDGAPRGRSRRSSSHASSASSAAASSSSSAGHRSRKGRRHRRREGRDRSRSRSRSRSRGKRR